MGWSLGFGGSLHVGHQFGDLLIGESGHTVLGGQLLGRRRKRGLDRKSVV